MFYLMPSIWWNLVPLRVIFTLQNIKSHLAWVRWIEQVAGCHHAKICQVPHYQGRMSSSSRINCPCCKIAVSRSKSASMTLPDPVQTIWCSLLFVQAQTVDHTLCIKKRDKHCCDPQRFCFNSMSQHFKKWYNWESVTSLHTHICCDCISSGPFIQWNGLCDSTAPALCSCVWVPNGFYVDPVCQHLHIHQYLMGYEVAFLTWQLKWTHELMITTDKIIFNSESNVPFKHWMKHIAGKQLTLL
jgi:hypothetical protein